jgi:phosphatidylinositol alpha 1,6-mannosyltransferase
LRIPAGILRLLRGAGTALSLRAGRRSDAGASLKTDNVWTLELPRGFLSFALEKDLRFDPAFLRHIPLIGEVLERFKPDLIHMTGPSEVGMLGAGLAHHLGLPLAASWHTNVHEYAGAAVGLDF